MLCFIWITGLDSAWGFNTRLPMLHHTELLSDTFSVHHVIEHSHPSQWDDPQSKLHSATNKHSRTCLFKREDYAIMLLRTKRKCVKY